MCSCSHRLPAHSAAAIQNSCRGTYSKWAELDWGYSLQKEFSPYPEWPEILVWWFCPLAIYPKCLYFSHPASADRRDSGSVRALRHQAQSCYQGQEWKIPVILLLLSELAHLSAKVVLSHLWPWPEFSKINKLLVSLHQLYRFFPSGLSAHAAPSDRNGPLPPFTGAQTCFSGLNSVSPGNFSWSFDTDRVRSLSSVLLLQ